jgi:hypothetical protein
MAASKAYLQDELSQKIPQKIISHFQITRNIGKDEQILAVFGGAQFMGITSSAVSTKNRLVYLNNAGIAPKQYVIHYADIEREQGVYNRHAKKRRGNKDKYRRIR